jgi:hypothetical protein
MRPKYSKRTVDEAVLLLDCYASQAAWDDDGIPAMLFPQLTRVMGPRGDAHSLAVRAWDAVPYYDGDLQRGALEAAQRLREGWRP